MVGRIHFAGGESDRIATSWSGPAPAFGSAQNPPNTTIRPDAGSKTAELRKRPSGGGRLFQTPIPGVDSVDVDGGDAA